MRRMVIPRESHQYEINESKVKKAKNKSIVISSFKTDTDTVLGGFSERKEYTEPLTLIRTLDP